MFKAGILLVVVFDGVLICLILSQLIRNFFGDQLANLILVVPFDIAKELIELLEDVGEEIKLRFCFAASTLRSTSTTVAPFPWYASAIALPMPEAPPVTTATLPVSGNDMSIFACPSLIVSSFKESLYRSAS